MRIQRNQNQEISSAFEHFASIISILLLPLISCQLVAYKCARAHVLLPLAGLVVREISRAFKLVNLSNGNIYRRFNFTCNTNIITYLLAHTHTNIHRAIFKLIGFFSLSLALCKAYMNRYPPHV